MLINFTPTEAEAFVGLKIDGNDNGQPIKGKIIGVAVHPIMGTVALRVGYTYADGCHAHGIVRPLWADDEDIPDGYIPGHSPLVGDGENGADLQFDVID